MKKILSLLLVFALAISLVACTSSNTDLYTSFKNMQDVDAIETDTDISFKLEGEDLGYLESAILDQAASFLNNMNLNIKNKSIGDKDNTKAKSESEINIELKSAALNMIIPLKLWSDIDLEASNMKTIINIPSQILGDIIHANAMESEKENILLGKKYIIYDMAKAMELDDSNLNYKEMIEFQKQFRPKLIEFMEDAQKALKLDSNIIKLKEEKQVDGEKLKLYSINLNDRSLRKVVTDLVNYTLENQATKEFMIEDELSNLEADLDSNIEKIKSEFHKFMEKYKDLQILGEEGINVIYSVNKDGYIIEEDGVMDFNVNLGEIVKLKQSEEKDSISYLMPPKGKIKFKINYNSSNTNINSRDLNIELPEITEKNSIDIKELIDIQTKQKIKDLKEIED